VADGCGSIQSKLGMACRVSSDQVEDGTKKSSQTVIASIHALLQARVRTFAVRGEYIRMMLQAEDRGWVADLAKSCYLRNELKLKHGKKNVAFPCHASAVRRIAL
jgi:hypothetical protein